MRLVKFAQAAIGLAASGGVAVVLSGSALAADSGVATTSQPASVTAPVVGKQLPQPPVMATQQEADKSSPASAKSESQTTASGTTVSNGGPSDASSVSSDKQGLVTPTAKGETPVASKEPVTEHGATVPEAPVVTKPNEEYAAPVTHAQAPVAPMAVVITTPVVDAAQVLSQPVVYHSTVLTIKPTITSHVALAADLAAAIPSAPLPAKEPTPTRSSGLLGNLTAQLAGTVLPQALLSDGSILDHLMLVLNLMMLSVLLINVFTFTYGLWLRRGGFATAARSDAPYSNLLVATPLLSGYAALPLRSHGPLFSGGRNEILKSMRCVVPNVFRKEERS
jgi:hypothetical protein